MILVIGTNIPNRVRGVLKIWLIELKAGVLIGDVNIVIENRIVKFIEPYLNKDGDLLVIRSIKNIQGFEVLHSINFSEKLHQIDGLLLSKKSTESLTPSSELETLDDLSFD